MLSNSNPRNQKIEASIKSMTAELEKEWERIGESGFENTQVACIANIKDLNDSIAYLKSHIKQFV
jgi:uncharacterized protein YukE